MSGKSELELNDALIREALHLEFEAVKAPPSDQVWQRIESGLDQTRPPAKLPAYSWSRLAAVAAACLVIVFGTIHVSRIIQFSGPAADFADLPVDSGEEVAMLAVEEAPAGEVEVATAPKDAADSAGVYPDESDDVLLAARADSDFPPTAWPPTVAGGIILHTTLILVADDGPEYHGALYSSSNDELLWVRSTAAGEEMATFISYLSSYIASPLEEMGVTNGFTRLELVELPGLAWQEDGLNQALLVISGSTTEEDLKDIAFGIEMAPQ